MRRGCFQSENRAGLAFSRVGNNNVADFSSKPPVGHRSAANRPPERRPNLKIQIGIHISIQIQFALLLQLHHGNPGKQLEIDASLKIVDGDPPLFSLSRLRTRNP
jgi:hypothetical protein